MEELDFQAVATADERFWANHPELEQRALTLEPSDARYRSEWKTMYEQAARESKIPTPVVVPNPAPPPPPINAASPIQVCPVVASMTHEEKIGAAIHSANLGEEALRELGDPKILAAGFVVSVVIVGGILAFVPPARVATAIAVFSGAGTVFSGWQFVGGINCLREFAEATRCDRAQTPQQLRDAGAKFGQGIAKVGIGTVSVVLALLGGRGRNRLGMTPTVLPRAQRLTIVFRELESAPAAKNAKEAMGLMNRTLDRVEDAYSGVPKNPTPGLKPDGRMYPARLDRTVYKADGTITATSRGHVTEYGPRGSITVTTKSGNIVFYKPGISGF